MRFCRVQVNFLALHGSIRHHWLGCKSEVSIADLKRNVVKISHMILRFWPSLEGKHLPDPKTEDPVLGICVPGLRFQSTTLKSWTSDYHGMQWHTAWAKWNIPRTSRYGSDNSFCNSTTAVMTWSPGRRVANTLRHHHWLVVSTHKHISTPKFRRLIPTWQADCETKHLRNPLSLQKPSFAKSSGCEFEANNSH